MRMSFDGKKILLRAFAFFLGIEFLLFFLNDDQYFQISGMAIPLVLACLAGAVVSIQESRNRAVKIRDLVSFLFIGWLLIVTVVHFQATDKGYLLSYLLLLVVILEMEIAPFERVDAKIIVWGYIVSAAIISILILGFRERYYADLETRLTIHIGSRPFIDPNYLGAYLAAPVVFCLDLFFESKKNITKAIVIALALIILLGVLLTGSRGAMLATLVGILLTLCSKLRIKVKGKFILIALCALVLGVVFLWRFVPRETLMRYLQVSTWMDSSNSRRLELWVNALNAIKLHPIAGYGINNTAILIGEVTGDFEPAHNSFLEIWVQMGIPGFAFILYLFADTWRKARRLAEKAVIVVNVIVSLLISSEVTLFFWMNLEIISALGNLYTDE